MKQIKTFEAFDTYPGKIVFRALRREFNKDYDDVQYYAENINYAKLSKETRDFYNGCLFAVHSTYMNPESEDYGYKGLRDTIFVELGKEEFYEFQKEFNTAKIIKGKDSGNESQNVYAVRDNSLVTPL